MDKNVEILVSLFRKLDIRMLSTSSPVPNSARHVLRPRSFLAPCPRWFTPDHCGQRRGRAFIRPGLARDGRGGPSSAGSRVRSCFRTLFGARGRFFWSTNRAYDQICSAGYASCRGWRKDHAGGLGRAERGQVPPHPFRGAASHVLTSRDFRYSNIPSPDARSPGSTPEIRRRGSRIDVYTWHTTSSSARARRSSRERRPGRHVYPAVRRARRAGRGERRQVIAAGRGAAGVRGATLRKRHRRGRPTPPARGVHAPASPTAATPSRCRRPAPPPAPPWAAPRARRRRAWAAASRAPRAVRPRRPAAARRPRTRLTRRARRTRRTPRTLGRRACAGMARGRRAFGACSSTCSTRTGTRSAC